MFVALLALSLGVLWGGVEPVLAQDTNLIQPSTWGGIKAMYGADGKASSQGVGVGKTGIDQVWAPINPWEPIGGYGFLRYVSGRGYHLGDDCVRSAGTPVYAMYDGFVRYARYNSGGWGYLMIVESTISGTTFCAVYGHLGATMYPGEGRNVGRGQYIGTVGSTAGKWPEPSALAPGHPLRSVRRTDWNIPFVVPWIRVVVHQRLGMADPVHPGVVGRQRRETMGVGALLCSHPQQLFLVVSLVV